MKQVEKIWSEMASKKAELSKEKVDLSNAKEVNKMYKQIDSAMSAVKKQYDAAQKAKIELDNVKKKARQAASDFSSSVNSLDADYERLDSSLLRFEQALKDLGVAPKDSPDYNGGAAILQQAKSNLDKYNKLVQSMKSDLNL